MGRQREREREANSVRWGDREGERRKECVIEKEKTTELEAKPLKQEK